MSTQLLERPKVNAAELDDRLSDSTSAVDDRQFHTVSFDDVKRLNELGSPI